ncbi:GNAT family N-acetyltransferase [Shewanella olleyana]|uniref:GNAT family N-acetyltransferase n=1 Tax=Shewanella olleyana TaxID=135626 RepID=UPI00200CD674|nr:GNAT family N-acetyltransferase [Shewanella olleyana]MCL1065668.1 GNAT family N-acetyltransferase [Shewanella olleyana]
MTLIVTQRLKISLMTLDDADLLFELDQDPAVMQYINGGEAPSRQEIEDVSIPRLAKYLNQEKCWGQWKVFDLNDVFLGWILIRPMGFFSDKPKLDDLEIGWRFKQATWGNGIATESALALINHISQQQDSISKFSAIADPLNTASIKVMKKLGMTYIETQQYHDENEAFDVVLYSLDVTNRKVK